MIIIIIITKISITKIFDNNNNNHQRPKRNARLVEIAELMLKALQLGQVGMMMLLLLLYWQVGMMMLFSIRFVIVFVMIYSQGKSMIILFPRYDFTEWRRSSRPNCERWSLLQHLQRVPSERRRNNLDWRLLNNCILPQYIYKYISWWKNIHYL